MPVEIRDRKEFIKIVERAEECRVKESKRIVKTESGVETRKILKIKARTKRYLYTIVFEDYSEGLEFAKTIKDKCKSFTIIDASLQGKI